MILQPFVENSIWHGLAVKENGGEIHVTFHVNEFNALIIQIEDDGIGIRKASENKRPGHQSIGINHIAERLDMLNKREEGSVRCNDLADEGGHGTRVVLTLYPGCYEA
jgi:sensor histidine kinase YesM